MNKLVAITSIMLFWTSVLAGTDNVSVKKTKEIKTRLLKHRLEKNCALFKDSRFIKDRYPESNITNELVQKTISDILDSTNEADKPTKDALETLGFSLSLFKEKKSAIGYLNGISFEGLLTLINAISFLGLQNIEAQKEFLGKAFSKKKESAQINLSNYTKIVNALEYLEKDKKKQSLGISADYFRASYKPYAIKKEILENIIIPHIPLITFSKDLEDKTISSQKRHSILDPIVEKILTGGYNKYRKPLLRLHKNLALFSNNNLEEIQSYLETRSIEKILALIQALEFFEAQNLGEKIDLIERVLIKKIRKDQNNIAVKNYVKILKALTYLTQKTVKPKNNSPYCVFKIKNVPNAGFDEASNEKIWLLTKNKLRYETIAKNKEIYSGEEEKWYSLGNPIISPDKKTVASQTPYHSIRPNITFTKINATTPYENEIMFKHRIGIYAFSSDSKFLYLSFRENGYAPIENNADGFMSKISVPSGELILDFCDKKLKKTYFSDIQAHDTNITSITPSPDGAYLISIAKDDPIIKIWDTKTGKLLKKIAGSRDVLCSAISNDSKLIALGRKNGSIPILDYENNKKLSLLRVKKPILSLTWSPGRKALLVKTPVDNTQNKSQVSLWDIETQTELMQIGREFDLNATMSFRNDGAYFLVSDSNEITIWKIRKNISAVKWFETTYNALRKSSHNT